jgi:hypothetical protein
VHAQFPGVARVGEDHVAAVWREVGLIVFAGAARQRDGLAALHRYLPERAASRARGRKDDGVSVRGPRRPSSFAKIVRQAPGRTSLRGEDPEIAVWSQVGMEERDHRSVGRQGRPHRQRPVVRGWRAVHAPDVRSIRRRRQEAAFVFEDQPRAIAREVGVGPLLD